MRVLSKSLAAMVAAATLVGGGAFAVAGTAYAADNDAITVTPNPWYANSFDGWGTSLAWFANATGSLGEESAITTNLGDDASKAKAVEYGKQLREQFYQSIFGDEGLDLNMPATTWAAAMPPMLPTATHSCAKALPCLARGKMTPPAPARMAMA